MIIVRILKLAALAAVLYVVAMPLFSGSPPNFGITGGLLLVAIILIGYAILGIKGLVFQRNSAGHRFDILDVLLLGAFPLYLIYIGNERYLTSLDTIGTRQLPVTILQKGTMDLSVERTFSGKSQPYYLVDIGGRKLSAFPLGTAFLAVPYTAVAMFAFHDELGGEQLLVAEKQFSALVSVLSALLLFLTLRSKTGEEIAAKSAIVFALGTGMFSCASQAMWSFTGEIFFLTLALYLFVKADQQYLAGLAAGAAFLCRPTALLIIAIAAIFHYRFDKKRLRGFAVSSLVSVCAGMALLYAIYGHPLGGYGMVNSGGSEWKSNFFNALLGNLISPSRGLFIYFPFVILCVIVLFLLKNRSIWPITCILCIAAILVLTSMFTKWWGGHSLGPRLLTETSILIALLTIPLWPRKGWIKAAFLLLLAFSICTQFLFVYKPAAAAWSSEVQIDAHPEMLWDWRNSQLAAAWGL